MSPTATEPASDLDSLDIPTIDSASSKDEENKPPKKSSKHNTKFKDAATDRSAQSSQYTSRAVSDLQTEVSRLKKQVSRLSAKVSKMSSRADSRDGTADFSASDLSGSKSLQRRSKLAMSSDKVSSGRVSKRSTSFGQDSTRPSQSAGGSRGSRSRAPRSDFQSLAAENANLRAALSKMGAQSGAGSQF